MTLNELLKRSEGIEKMYKKSCERYAETKRLCKEVDALQGIIDYYETVEKLKN